MSLYAVEKLSQYWTTSRLKYQLATAVMVSCEEAIGKEARLCEENGFDDLFLCACRYGRVSASH